MAPQSQSLKALRKRISHSLTQLLLRYGPRRLRQSGGHLPKAEHARTLPQACLTRNPTAGNRNGAMSAPAMPWAGKTMGACPGANKPGCGPIIGRKTGTPTPMGCTIGSEKRSLGSSVRRGGGAGRCDCCCGGWVKVTATPPPLAAQDRGWLMLADELGMACPCCNCCWCACG
ncbi:hypothetical protein Vretimale_8022 [Volvox reticuliferus]|uniref:Uncharacterized protein n=1 Tax=Volvox reticuliferus TaxID=1737510 RepID=A0A8J4LN76_9CHLO|nr:hypothetical protein Vretifemale_5097 [Volvox reticuliferus]GIM03228.1 hypothetical protein Vretimale_8022 [Volvox reticuliferus]